MSATVFSRQHFACGMFAARAIKLLMHDATASILIMAKDDTTGLRDGFTDNHSGTHSILSFSTNKNIQR